MKNKIIPVAILVVLAVLALAFLGGSDVSASPALVTTVVNDVFVKELDETDFQTVDGSREAHEGSVVKTSATGRAIIESSDVIITTVDRNSEYQIVTNRGNGAQTSLRLSAGNLWAQVGRSLEQGEYYEVETQNVVASVRGTSFSISAEGDISDLMVVEGEVTVRTLDENRQVIEGSEIKVRAGEKAHISGFRGESTTESLTPTDMQDEWYRFNMELGSELQIKREEETRSVETMVDINVDIDRSDDGPDTGATIQIEGDIFDKVLDTTGQGAAVKQVEKVKSVEAEVEIVKTVEKKEEDTNVVVPVLWWNQKYFFPLSQFEKSGPDRCPADHYHAKVAYGIASPESLEIVSIPEPISDSCGFGRVKDAVIIQHKATTAQVGAFSQYLDLTQ